MKANKQNRDQASIGPRKLKEPGSIEYCWQTVNYLKHLWGRYQDEKEYNRNKLSSILDEVILHKVWEKIPPEQPYGTLDQLLEQELGLPEEVARAVASKEVADVDLLEGYLLGKWGGDRRSEEFTENQPYNSKVESWGNNKSYIVARLARDHPDILDEFMAGKHKSARQAGIVAGFIKDVKYIQVLPEPGKIAEKLGDRLSRQEIIELIELLQKLVSNGRA